MPVLTTNGVTHVSPPALTPRKRGIFDAADVVALSGHESMGVVYQAIESALVKEIPEDISTCISTALDEQYEGFDWVYGDSAFFIFTGVECNYFDNNPAEFLAVAKARLAASAQRAVENHLWTKTFASATDLNPAGALPLEDAIALLADYAGTHYDFVPTIHFSPGTGVHLTADRLQNFDGAFSFETKVAQGSGYTDKTGPYVPPVGNAEPGPGVEAGDGEAWIYLTGQIGLRQGAVEAQVVPDTQTNRLLAIAEQPYVVTVDGFTVAVRVTQE